MSELENYIISDDLELVNQTNYKPLNKVLLVGASLILMNNPVSADNKKNIRKTKIQLSSCNNKSIENYIEKSKKIDSESEYLINNFPTAKYDLKKKITQDILGFKSFDKSWNGYGAIPTEIKSATNTIKLLFELSYNDLNKINEYYPNPHGTISIVFKNDSEEIIEAEVGNEEYSFYASFDGLATEYVNNVSTENFKNSYLFKLISYL
tara:strand:- start:489 stop:1112 length:624 start_codon:yes stop_codon:yes gene_type:complete